MTHWHFWQDDRTDYRGTLLNDYNPQQIPAYLTNNNQDDGCIALTPEGETAQYDDGPVAATVSKQVLLANSIKSSNFREVGRTMSAEETMAAYANWTERDRVCPCNLFFVSEWIMDAFELGWKLSARAYPSLSFTTAHASSSRQLSFPGSFYLASFAFLSFAHSTVMVVKGGGEPRVPPARSPAWLCRSPFPCPLKFFSQPIS